MPRRIIAVTAIATALCVVGCGSPPPPTTDPAPPSTSASAGSTAPASTATTGAADPTPGTVPVDQIPPGRPASWIPAGMPTAAPWKEPGDVLPMFTLTMFQHTPAGALAAASYYTSARNWALATLNSEPFLLLCDSQRCRENAKTIDSVASSHGHVAACRESTTHQTLVPVDDSSDVEWIVRLNLALQAGGIVDARGRVQRVQPASTEVNDLYMRWSGKMWRVHEDALGR